MDKIEDAVHTLLTLIGEDTQREGLRDTPQRTARAWMEWCSGYGQKPEDELKVFEDGADGYDELVFQGRIPLFSHCEHHMAAIIGVCHVGYIPKGKIVGLSKLARVVDIFAKRLQVQERMTRQIADCLYNTLAPEAVGVVMRCRHMCMESRGVNKPGTITYTSALRGSFRDHGAARAEFMTFVARADHEAIL